MSPTLSPMQSLETSVSSISIAGIVLVSLLAIVLLLAIVVLVLLRRRWTLESDKTARIGQRRDMSEWHYLESPFHPASNSARSTSLQTHEGPFASRSFYPTATNPNAGINGRNSGRPGWFRGGTRDAPLLNREAREAIRRNNNA